MPFFVALDGEPVPDALVLPVPAEPVVMLLTPVREPSVARSVPELDDVESPAVLEPVDPLAAPLEDRSPVPDVLLPAGLVVEFVGAPLWLAVLPEAPAPLVLDSNISTWLRSRPQGH